MICKFCSQEIDNAATFCPFCGQSVSADTAPNANEANPFAATEPMYGVPQPPVQPPKKKKGFGGLIAIVAVVAVVALALFNIDGLTGFFVKNFKSPQTYLAYVETKQIKSLAGDSLKGDVLDSVLDPGSAIEEGGTHQEFNFKLGDYLVDAVGIDELDEFGFKIDSCANKKVSKTSMTYYIGDTDLLTAEFFVNLKTNEIYVGVVDLSDEYLYFDVDALEIEGETYTITDKDRKLIKKLFKTYTEVLLDSLNDVTKTSGSTNAGSISEKCTVLTLEISEQSAMELAIALMKETQTNKDLKELILNQDAFGQDMYDDMLDAIEDSLEYMEEYVEEADDEPVVVYTSYVNNNHEVIGRELEVKDEDIFSYQTATKGKKTAIELNVMDQIELEGELTTKGGKQSGNLELTMMDEEIATVTFTNFSLEKFCGEIRIEMNDDFKDLSGMKDDLTLVITLNKKGKTYTVNGSMFMDDYELCTMEYVTSPIAKKNFPKLELPSKNDTVDLEDIEDWVSDFDPEDLLDNLPSELEDLLSGSIGGMGSSTYPYYDDYYDDYYDFDF